MKEKTFSLRTDSAQLDIFVQRFRSIAEEMGYSLQRTGHTAFVNETADLGVALVTRDGEIFGYPHSIGITMFANLNFKKEMEAHRHPTDPQAKDNSKKRKIWLWPGPDRAREAHVRHHRNHLDGHDPLRRHVRLQAAAGGCRGLQAAAGICTGLQAAAAGCRRCQNCSKNCFSDISSRSNASQAVGLLSFISCCRDIPNIFGTSIKNGS